MSATVLICCAFVCGKDMPGLTFIVDGGTGKESLRSLHILTHAPATRVELDVAFHLQHKQHG